LADRADPLSAGAGAPRGLDRPGAFAAILAALVVAEAALFLWYLTVPLPNAEAARTTLPDGTVKTDAIRRWYLLAEAIPYFVPGNDWDDSLLGLGLDKLAHVENLPERLPLIGAGLWLASAGVGLGLTALRALRLGRALRLAERLPLAFGLGMAGLGVLALISGRLGWLSPWTVRIGLGAPAICGLVFEAFAARRGASPRDPRPSAVGRRAALLRGLAFAALAAPFLVIMVLGSLQPSIEFDSLEYHLQGPKEWYLAGRIGFLPHNVYTTMPFNVEMLHLLGMHLLGDWWRGALVGQFVVMLHTPMAAAMIALTASRLGSPRAGWLAALIYLSTPWAYRLSVFPYVEGPLNYYHAALLWCGLRAWPPPSTIGHRSSAVAPWAACGALAGGAMACKYPAFVSAVIPFGALALLDAVRRRSWPIPLAFAAGLALTIGPWLAKNAIDHGNPVYPLAADVLGGRPWSPGRQAKWSAAHGPRPITGPELANGLSEVAGRNDWQSPLYLALAPLAFLRRGSRRAALMLALYAGYIFATWWLLTHRLDRFWLPLLAPLAVLAGLGADWSRRLGWSILLAALLALGLTMTLTYDSTDLAAFNFWTDPLDDLRRRVPRIASPTLAWLDENLPPDAKILLVGQAGVFHMRHPVVFNTVFDDEILETIARDRTPDQIRRSLADRGITHLLVDWSEVARHRKPGGYGFTDFVQPEVFDRLARAGVIEPIPGPGATKDLYRVR
jgi:hypothetical protein